jgi:FPC/CPF motif-containing protein YcgG
MTAMEPAEIINDYFAFLNSETFPCIGARAAMQKQNLRCMVAGNMACPAHDPAILQFLYTFVDDYRKSKNPFHSAVIIFNGPLTLTEESFDELMWKRLQALANIDEKNYKYDSRVNPDPLHANFSFSLKEEAFFIIGLHAASSRQARQFSHPALAFNPHAQFEQLKQTGQYEKIKNIVRNRDMAYSGSVNPMLNDFGSRSEACQYSGRAYEQQWKCPLNTRYANTKHNSTP